MKTTRFILFAFLVPVFTSAQTNQSGDILNKITTIINAMPGAGTNVYAVPTADDLNDWEDLLDLLFAEEYAAADAAADDLGYDLVAYMDNTNGETYYVLEKLGSSSNHWGTYILNPGACRESLVLMAPHPKHDFNTGKQAAYCFKNIDAAFFMMAGTHRCNNMAPSGCSGTSDVCTGSDDPYRLSDMAHVTDAIFQKTTEYLNGQGAFFVQLHGFTKLQSDPYVIMSNGTRETPVPDPIATLRDELLAVDPVLTFKIAHLDPAWNRLIGFHNTNGRLINGSADHCLTHATVTDGRFLHIEQEKTRLRDDESGWHKMAVALSQTFDAGPCPVLLPLPVELAAFSAKLEAGKVRLRWETASERDNHFFEVEKSRDARNFQAIVRLVGAGDSHLPQVYEYVDIPSPGHNYYRLRQTDHDGTEAFSKVISIFYGLENAHIGRVGAYQNKLWVQLEQDGPASLRLFDPLGRLVLEKYMDGQANPLTFDGPAGIYFYQLEQEGNGLQVGKVLLAGG